MLSAILCQLPKRLRVLSKATYAPDGTVFQPGSCHAPFPPVYLQQATAALTQHLLSEDISISYGSSTVEYESGASKSDQEADAIGVSWTNGSMSITASRHDIANVSGTSTDDRDVTEVNLTFAF